MDEYKLKQIAKSCNMKPEEVKQVMEDIAFEAIAKKEIADNEDVEKMANALTK